MVRVGNVCYTAPESRDRVVCSTTVDSEQVMCKQGKGFQ